jgi:hypothetical protein
MDNEGLKTAIIRVVNKNYDVTPENLNGLKESSDIIQQLRVKIDNKLEEIKINIIKSSTHLLIDKIHRGDVETSIKILENTGDRTVFYDFIALFDELLILHEEYHQKLDFECSIIKEIKENLGINDHKIHKVISEINLGN